MGASGGKFFLSPNSKTDEGTRFGVEFHAEKWYYLLFLKIKLLWLQRRKNPDPGVRKMGASGAEIFLSPNSKTDEGTRFGV